MRRNGIHVSELSSPILINVIVLECCRWIRLDARGNKDGGNAQFSLDEEILAFHICSEGEIDYYDNHAEPDQGLMKVLETSSDELHMSQIELSRRTGIATSTISDWRKKKINPQADKLVTICKALDVSLVDLLCNDILN